MSQFILGFIFGFGVISIGAAAVKIALHVIMAIADKKQEKSMKSDTIDRAALQRIGECRHQLTRQQFKTLKGQILAGDSPGALKGLHKIMATKRKRGHNAQRRNNTILRAKGEADHQTREMDI